MDTLRDRSASAIDSNEPRAPFDHWTYRVDSQFRPVHELVESSSGGSTETSSEGSWEATEPMRGSVALEALEALEDYQGEHDDFEDSEENEDFEDSEESEDLEDSEEGEAGYEELGALRSSPGGPRDIVRRDVGAEELGEDEFEDEEEGEEGEGEEFLPRRVGQAVIAGLGRGGRRRRDFLDRGDTPV